jgi:aminopeptidase N
MEVDVYTGSGKTTHKIVLTGLNQSFRFKSSEKPELVNVDARKVLLAEKIENKSTAEYLVQWQKAPLYLDKLEALQHLQQEVNNPQAKAVFEEAFGFNHWQIRAYAIEKWNFDQWKSDVRFAEQLKTFTRSDADTRVRAAALEKLGETNAKMHTSVFVHSVTTDSSYRVNGTALRQLAKADSSLALEFALGFEDVRYVRSAVYDIYGNFGDAGKADFFERNWATAGNQRFQLMNNYTKLALRINEREFIGRVISFYSAQDPTLSGWQKRTALEQRKKLETALTKLK